MRTNSRLIQSLVFSLTLLPPCLVAILIFKYGVDLPQWDQWSYVKFFEKFSHGSLTLGDLFHQVNEYRQFFPNVVFVALGWLTHWDVRYEMFLTLLVACFISLNVYRLAERTIGGTRLSRLFLFLLANLIIFSPAQYENWLQGQQLVYFVPIACVTTCLLVVGSRLTITTKSVICAGLSAVSTFSSANGIVCWIVVLPALFLIETSKGSRARTRLVCGWTIGFFLSVCLYFYHYRKPGWSPSLFTAVFRPLQALTYFLGFVGAPLALERAILAIAIGSVVITVFGISCVYFFRGRADRALLNRMTIWLMIGAYSVLTGVLTTIGRLGFGVGQSQATRYQGYSAYLLVSLVYLITIMTRDFSSRPDSGRQALLIRRLALLAAALLISAQPLIFILSINRMDEMRTLLLQAKASILFINFKPDTLLITTLYPDLDRLTREANVLDSLGFLRPKLIKTLRVQEFAAPGGSNPAAYGSWNQFTRSEDNRYVASGWAILPDRGTTPDAIILAYQTTGGETLMFHTTRPQDKPAEVWYRRRNHSTAWKVSFSTDELPPAPATLSAWGFDANTGKAFRLDGSFEIPTGAFGK